MKYYYLLFVAVLSMVLSCSFDDPQNVKVRSGEHEILLDEQMLQLNDQILKSLKNKDWATFTNYIHPDKGVYFSPYAFLEPYKAVHLTKTDFVKGVEENQEFVWGEYDGVGGEIIMTITDYTDQFLYNIDFLKKATVYINEFRGSGNSINNLQQVFPDHFFLENYFSGENVEYDGMDWQALRVVIETKEGKHYVIALINDRWTI